MNQKRNQIEVSGYIKRCYLRFVISRSAVRVRSPAPFIGNLKVPDLHFKASKLTQSSNQKGNQWGVTCCKVIGKRVIDNHYNILLHSSITTINLNYSPLINHTKSNSESERSSL